MTDSGEPAPPATPRGGSAVRTAWLLLGGVVTGVVLAAGSAATYVGLNWPADVQTEQATNVVSTNIATIDIQGDLGDVVVTADPRQSRVVIDRQMRWDWQKPMAGQDVVGAVLQLRSGCGRLLAAACAVSYVLLVPPGVEVRATTVGGAIRVRGTSGSLRLAARTGSIEVRDCAGRIDVSTDEGSVTGLGLRGTEARVAARLGDVNLAFAVAPDMVMAESGRGDIDIAVPGGADRDSYQVRAGETTGAKQIGVRTGSDAGAARTIVGSARRGSLTVRYAGPAPSE